MGLIANTIKIEVSETKKKSFYSSQMEKGRNDALGTLYVCLSRRGLYDPLRGEIRDALPTVEILLKIVQSIWVPWEKGSIIVD